MLGVSPVPWPAAPPVEAGAGAVSAADLIRFSLSAQPSRLALAVSSVTGEPSSARAAASCASSWAATSAASAA